MTLCLIFLFVLSIATAWALLDFGLNFTVLSPESCFKKNVDRLGYGAGFGMLINLKTFKLDDESPSRKHGRLMLDFRVRYMFGGEIEYLKEGSISQDENENVIYDVNKSDTDFMSYHIGLVFSIF